ncbi:unnamed protein product [Brachionus calyciflorus]|uniref:FLYWCH-type domain-containing protein n=1 Tax=Brachionus calyciflorus TaxID=104777 RepID=A0A813N3W4_9BILA|nr:unnamed protein product [Brachionus calyciflorus]
MQTNYTIIPTSRSGHYLFYQKHLFYKVKPKNPVTGITTWRCRRYHNENVKCKAFLKANDEIVLSLTNEHEKHDEVGQFETVMLSAKQEIKEKISTVRVPVKMLF